MVPWVPIMTEKIRKWPDRGGSESAGAGTDHWILQEYLEQGARQIRTNTFAANHAMALGRGIRDRREQDAYENM